VATRTFQLEINGTRRSVEADGGTPLIYVLRNDLGLKGTRFGCGEEACGACTVLAGDQAVQSCRMTVETAARRQITTIEGLSGPGGAPGRVQAALLARRAGQCGFCLSGIAMRIEAGLRAGLATRAQFIEALAGNLCRCGAHGRILAAIDDLLAEGDH
jgi:aerobic-type carbon monoxide dehydrogenase small subunit (CoxS/CutS family)